MRFDRIIRRVVTPFPTGTPYQALDLPGVGFAKTVTGVWRPISSVREYGQIHYSLIEWFKQVRFMFHCVDEWLKRNRRSQAKKYTFTLLLKDSDERRQWQEQAYRGLTRIAARIAEDRLPDGTDLENVAAESLWNWIKTLRDKPYHVQMASLGTTRTAIERDIIDKYRGSVGRPETVSLDAIEETQNNEDSPPTFKIPLPNVTPKEPLRPLKDWQIAQLDEILGEMGRQVFVYIREHSDLIGEGGRLIHGAKKEIAEAIGCAQSTVGEYWGRNGKIQQNAKKISEIL